MVAREHHKMIEGAAGVALAAVLKMVREEQEPKLIGKNIIVVLCGANIGLDTFKELL